MRISLVYPAIAGWGFNSYKNHNLEASWVSHGLAMLSACAKADGNYVDLLDLRRLKGWKHYGAELKRQRPDLVGVYMSSVDFNPALKAIACAREVLPKVKIAVGGPHPSLVPEELVDNPHIDNIFVGEGEISFPRLLDDLSRGTDSHPRIIQGEKPDLDAIPFMDRTLFGAYEMSPARKIVPEPFVSVIAGRGCIFRCKFCQPAEARIFGRKVRRRSVDNVIEELRTLKRNYSSKGFILHDDCLTEDRKWVRAFCDAFRKEGWDMGFICQSRADLICKDPALIREMAETGLKLLIIGFESGSQRVLDFIGKGTTVEQNFRAAEICRASGVRIWGNYMLGIPTETKEEVLETVRMMRQIRPDIYAPSFFTPHVGSQLYDYCLENGLWSPTSHDDFRRNATAPKIKGVDYGFLFKALELSKNRPLPERVAKRVVRKVVGPRNLLRTYQVLGKIARKLHLKSDESKSSRGNRPAEHKEKSGKP